MAQVGSARKPSNPAAQLLSAPSTTTVTTLTTSMPVGLCTSTAASPHPPTSSTEASIASPSLGPTRADYASPSISSVASTSVQATSAPSTQITPTPPRRSPPSTSLPSSARTADHPPQQPTTQPQHVSEARAAVVASISNLLDSELQTRARTLHGNAAAIARQERDVDRATAALRAENDKLARWSGDAAQRVKELGNVQNWAEVLEREFLVLEETARLVREGGEKSGREERGEADEEDEDEDGSEASWCSGSCCRSRSESRRGSSSDAAAVDGFRRKGTGAGKDAGGDVSMGDGSVKDGLPPS